MYSMDSLVKLQIINLFKKYDYLLNEYKLKIEISNLSYKVFQENVNKVINKEQIEQPLSEADNLTQDKSESEEKQTTIENEENLVSEDEQELKNIYRRIVKITHPDLINNDYLNSIYIEATNSFKIKNKLGLIRFAIVLGLDISLNEELTENLNREILKLEKQITFIESSYHMRWHSSNKEQKVEILLDYLKTKLKLSSI